MSVKKTKKIGAKDSQVFAIGDYVRILILESTCDQNLGQILRLSGDVATVEMSPFRADFLAEIMEIGTELLEFVAPSVRIKTNELRRKIILWKEELRDIFPDFVRLHAKLRGALV